MTPEIKKQYDELKILTEMLIPTLAVIRHFDLAGFERQARPFADGTMGILALQDMGIRDLRTTEGNLLHAIEVSKTIRKLAGLLIREPGETIEKITQEAQRA